jgi:hypothetical protein
MAVIIGIALYWLIIIGIVWLPDQWRKSKLIIEQPPWSPSMNPNIKFLMESFQITEEDAVEIYDEMVMHDQETTHDRDCPGCVDCGFPYNDPEEFKDA